MNRYLEDEKTSWLAFSACWLVYVVVCMAKNTYSASIAAIVNDGLFAKSSAGVISSGFYLFYGISQLAGGYLSDRFSPFAIVAIGLIGSIISSAVMALSDSFAVMLIAWSFNGLMQFGLWPSILKILSTVLFVEHRQKAMLYISTAYCIGTLLIYFCAMLVLNRFGWPQMFWLSACILVLALIFWCWSSHKVKGKLVVGDDPSVVRKKEPVQKNDIPLSRLLIMSGVLLLLVPALIRGMLDLGIRTWVPTMIMESYGVSPGFASLLTTVLVLINLTGVIMANKLYPRYMKNVTLAIATFFIASLPLTCLLLLIGTLHWIFIVLLLTAITTFMYGGNQLINVVVPAAFSRYQKTGTMAGILNAFACFGGVISNFGFGFLAEHFGWIGTIISWVILIGLAIVFAFLAVPLWAKFMRKEDDLAAPIHK